MRLDPLLRALRSDAAPQHAAQACVRDALGRWREANAAVLGELEAYGAGTPLADCAGLAALMTEPARAAAFTAGYVHAFAPALAAEPLARLPFRQALQGPAASLVLGQAGGAVLALATRAPGTCAAETVAFADGERRERVLAGNARAEILRRDRAGFGREPVVLRAGAGLELDMAREALLVTDVREGLVALRLTRLAERPQPTREYRLADGALLAQAAGDPRASRHELMLAVLGRMGRGDAAPVMAEMAREGCEHLRWQALRECLALDTAEGFRALAAIARDAADPLAPPAGALRAQLLEAHPQLAALDDRCPA